MAAKVEMVVVAHLAVFLLALHQGKTMAFPKDSSYRCQRSSPQLKHCVREGLSRVIRQFKAGDALLGVPPLDPMEIPYYKIQHDEGNLTLDLTMKNVNIFGFTDIVLAKVTTNLDDNDVKKLEVMGKTPALYISGQYISEGLIVTFPLHSAGTFNINMTDVTSSWVVYLRELTKNQTKYIQIDGFDIDMMPMNISFKPAEQLDGDNNLGEAVNIILNENSSEIYTIIKGKLALVFSNILTELGNQVLSQVPEKLYLV